jgi:hypothetical protein
VAQAQVGTNYSFVEFVARIFTGLKDSLSGVSLKKPLKTAIMLVKLVMSIWASGLSKWT